LCKPRIKKKGTYQMLSVLISKKFYGSYKNYISLKNFFYNTVFQKDKRILHSNDLLFRCVSFFNEAKYKDLLLAPRMTDKIASFIIEERPFDDFKHLQRKLYECPRGGLILQAYVDGLENRSVIENILEDCKLQSKKIQCTIHPHQEIGLKWLVLMHKLNLNAILADEMGLGKTIQIIAFLSYLKKESIKGPHLIIVPSSTVENWMYELKSWAPSIKILTYYGTLDERRHLRAMATDNTIDVLLTTYSMVGSKVEDRKFFKRFKINYVIYDEGHLLKNCSTERYKNLMKIHGERKILLTGTPLQNNLVELISLIYFTMTKLFRKYCNDVNQLLNQFQQKAPMMEAKNSMLYESEKIEQAKAILQPYILRRLKSDVLENLPIKHDRIIFCSMIDEQKRIYRDLMWEFKELSAKGKKVVTSKLMQLRQISNHPLLYRSRYTDDRVVKIAKVLCKKEETYYKKNPEHVAEDLSFLSDFAISQLCSKYKSTRKFCLNEDVALISGKFEVFDELLPKIKSQSDKVLIFSQFTAMMDIIEVYLKIRKYKCCRLDGATPVMERQELINKFNSSEDIFVFLLSTKAGGLGINLTTANHIIIHDIDFNPYNDKQAEDRCHRMGQKKEVYVVRLISSGTIEEEMLTIAQKKLQLEKEITGGNINGTKFVSLHEEGKSYLLIIFIRKTRTKRGCMHKKKDKEEKKYVEDIKIVHILQPSSI
uniref:SWI/SNF-related matrix-associated actin-dependent regulator of chromatin subfamily A containing DEAD/H box 1 homolog n=1 Tax=Dracunculus medinensis TaxID=318479 RepID=A0A0N4UIY2_DRAME